MVLFLEILGSEVLSLEILPMWQQIKRTSCCNWLFIVIDNTRCFKLEFLSVLLLQ